MHALSRKNLKSCNSVALIKLLRFHCTKLLDTVEDDHQALRFVNLVVFNTFVNQWCAKNDENVLKLAFSWFYWYSLKTQAYKKSNVQRYHKTRMLRIIVFWSNRKIKMSGNSKLSKNPRNENAAKISCFKVHRACSLI